MATGQIVDILLSITAFALGWMLKVIWGAVQDLQAEDKEIIDRLGRVELFVAQKYVTKDDMDKQISLLMAKLDRIENKLDTKADRANCEGIRARMQKEGRA